MSDTRWHPIETANTESARPVLLWTPHSMFVGYFDNGDWYIFGGRGMVVEATHWMPLPSPPGAEGQAEAAVPPLSVEKFRDEVKDKLSVYAIAEKGVIPLHRAIVMRQCEDFLVELYAEGLRAAASVAPHIQLSEPDDHPHGP